ncbi:MAG: hypothetical protein ACYC0Q_15410 [Eubacteriales bacterium]
MTEAGRWNIRQVYLYLVCFATLMMLIIGSVQLIMSLVDFVYPEQVYIPDAKLRYAEIQKDPGLTKEEIDRQVEEERQRSELAMERSRVRRVINSVALIVVSLPVYVYHWRKIQRGNT